MKRVFSLFLALVMLVSMVPVPARATGTNSSVDANDMTVEGTDSFGSLLSEELSGESVLADTYIDGYAITELTFTGNTAAVSYGAIGPARLVVSIYTEDGLTMLSTANTNVSEGEGEVTLTMPGDMPEYFYAAAFLLNPDDLTPLCDSYDTPMYTREMQELLDSTVDDYAEELVMNLDDREDTNFLVFEEDTIRAESSAAVNTVVSADDENMVYVIGNADETVLGLARGDIFSCSYGNNNLLIVKVDTISVDGTTVTIQGMDLQMEEVFSHIKIEYEGGGADIEVDESGCYEGIVYAGKEDGGGAYARRSTYADGGLDDKTELTFILDEAKWGEASMKGTLKIAPTASFDYYATADRKYVDLSIALKVSLSVNFKGKLPIKEFPLGPWGISPVPGVYIGFEPAFVVEFEASLNFGVTFFTETGITYEMGKAPKRHNVKPTVDIDIQVEGKLFVGIDLDPTVEVVGGKVIDLTLEMGIGFELTGKMGGQVFDGIQIAGQKNQEEKIHTCDHCLAVNVVFKTEISFKIEFLRLKALTKEFKLTALKIDLGSFYWSFTFDDFGWGGCPRLSYRVIVQVKDKDGDVVENIPVYDDKGNELGKTDEKGQVIVYRVEGEYTFSATVNGTKLQKTKNVSRASRVLLSEGVGTGISAIFGALEEEDVTNYGEVVMDGECGDFTTWVLYENGTLIIEGEGEITVSAGYWDEYKEDIDVIVIRDGVTSIPEKLFYQYDLNTVLIADSVTQFGLSCFGESTIRNLSVAVDYLDKGIPFSRSSGLEYIRYTPGETGIMADRKNYYKSLIEYGSRSTLKTMEFAEDVIKIGSFTLSYISSLQTVIFPSTLEEIGERAFAECGLQDVSFPDGLSIIGGYAFYCGIANEELEIPDSVTTIGEHAFDGCQITRLTIPDSVESFGKGCFSDNYVLEYVSTPIDYPVWKEATGVFDGCSNVKHIRYTPGRTGVMAYRGDRFSRPGPGNRYSYVYEFTMEYDSRSTLETVEFAEGVISLDSYALQNCYSLTSITWASTMEVVGLLDGCTSLKSIEIPEGVVEVRGIRNCTALTDIKLPSTLERIGGSAFAGCTAINEIIIPDSVTQIGSMAFAGCTGITEMEIPNSVSVIEYYAFGDCTGLTRLVIPDGISDLGEKSFANCTGLKYVSIPVDYPLSAYSTYDYSEYISDSFENCSNIEYIHYTPGITGVMRDHEYEVGTRDSWGSYTYESVREYTLEYHARESLKIIELATGVMELDPIAFTGVTANIYYDDESGVWTEDKQTGYGGTLTWLPLSALEAAAVIEEIPEETTEPVEEIAETQPEETVPETTEAAVNAGASSSASQPSGSPSELYSIFGGDYNTEETETQTLTVASFSGLVAGEEYVLLVVRNLKAPDLLDAENLIYIAQNAAEADGTLVFRYAKREDVKGSYVMVVGPSGKDLKDATITFPAMEADGDVHLVNPTVVYDGKTLTEGKDYNILGAGSYVKPGEYMCYIQGIHDYSGLVTCVYTVEGGIPGDIDGNETVDVDDVLALLWYVLFPDDYPIDAEADFDKSGSVDVDDVLTLLWYVLFPDEYPL